MLQDFIDPTMCYLPNGYPSTAYYYGGKFVYKYFWKMTWNASRETLQMQYLAQAEFVLFIAGYDGTGNEWDEYSRYVNSEGVEMTSVSIYFPSHFPKLLCRLCHSAANVFIYINIF